jgi:membrane protease YdiL (CAAX protease family)
VLLYLVGYFVVGIFVSIVVAMGLGILVGFGLVTLPPIEQELAAISPTDVEAVIRVMEPYLIHLVLATGLYSILYTWAFVRLMDRRRLKNLGVGFRRGWAADFAKGAILAVLIMGIVFAFSLVTGSIRIEGFARPAPEGTPIIAYLVGVVVAFLVVGFYEELMFRGYVLQRLTDRAGRIASIVVSSVIFAVFHGANPQADLFGIFNTALIGAVLCALYFRTGSLWMPIGFHAAWNFSLGYLYSLPVSGVPLYGILKVVEVDPDSRLTGGSYGPEAGLLSTIVIAVWGAWLIWRRTGRRPDGENGSG